MKKNNDWTWWLLIMFIAGWVAFMLGAIFYDQGYRDGQINAIEGRIDFEIRVDSTYVEK